MTPHPWPDALILDEMTGPTLTPPCRRNLQTAIAAIFWAGVETLAPNGVIGDPARCSVTHGERYRQVASDVL